MMNDIDPVLKCNFGGYRTLVRLNLRRNYGMELKGHEQRLIEAFKARRPVSETADTIADLPVDLRS